ncbi:MAG: hypothetical protein NTX15_09700 [Candidatus Kapabacteria bacterium]|nr:hypothetical protein [Candidatus Kapabacteria bacterium]
MTLPSIHPEIEQLKRRYLEAQGALRTVVEDWHSLSTEIRPRLNAMYDQFFGELERELQFKSLASAELFRRVELLSVKVARGEVLTPEIIDLVNSVVDKEYARFNRRLREALHMDTEQRERAAQQRVDLHDDEELVQMYRTLVKKLHPDASGQNSPGSIEWHRLQNAYKNRNVSQLRSLLAVLGAGDTEDEITNGWDLDRWIHEVHTLENRLHAEERKLIRLRGEEPFVISEELDNDEWREQHRRELLAALEVKDKELAENRVRYRELTGGDVKGGTNADASEVDEKFDQDFMKNTYFGQR